MLSPVIFCVIIFLPHIKSFIPPLPNGFDHTLPQHCQDVKNLFSDVSGFYIIKPKYSAEHFPVYCQMETPNEGWTYIMNRSSGGFLDFDMPWDSYVDGFGFLGGEFWLGLHKIYMLTGFEINQLLFELEDWYNNQPYAFYEFFNIGGKETNYTLKLIAEYQGDAGDVMSKLGGMKFSTKDADHDHNDGNCAEEVGGGLWYKDCTDAVFTKRPYPIEDLRSTRKVKGFFWNHTERNLLYKKVTMMVRPRPKPEIWF